LSVAGLVLVDVEVVDRLIRPKLLRELAKMRRRFLDANSKTTRPCLHCIPNSTTTPFRPKNHQIGCM
jgi:hypothetical protein